MTCTSTNATAPTQALRSSARVTGFAQLVKRVAELLAIARQRRELAALDATRLEDLGLSEGAARREASRPFWDAPSYWR